MAPVPHVGFQKATDTVHHLLATDTPRDYQNKPQLASLSTDTRSRVQADISASLQRAAVPP